MAEIVNIQNINPTTFEIQTYSPEDNALIYSTTVGSVFDPSIDIVEYFIYDLNKNILFENVIGYNNYYINNNIITLTPEENLKSVGFAEGTYNTLYNFVKPKLGSNPLNKYFISEISSDRTEIRLDTSVIPNDVVVTSSIELTNEIINSTGSYYDFYLNFGANQLIIANNVLLDNSTNPTVLIKLYEPLPQQFVLKNELWVVTKVADPVAYNVSINTIFNIENEYITLKGPNTNLNIKDQTNNSTDYANYSNLSSTNTSQGSGSFQYQLNSLLAEKGLEINIDYSDYSNFIHFSSAQTRLENFYYKLSLIEQYQVSASLSDNTLTNYYVSSSNVIWQNKINDIITNFDSYEYFLYYESGSTCWPKTGNTPPYTNVLTTSVTGQNWFTSQSSIATEYDSENNNALTLAIPSYITDDPENLQFELFIEMIGQSFDSVFVYLQDVTNKYNADNRLNYGVSKDLVADILRDMGIKIYQNNFSSDDLYSALIGFTPSGSLYNLPFTTTQLPVPANSFLEYIDTYITASSTGSLIPTEDINFETYKRIYHNLPLLLKKKGSTQGLKNLITTYGIPDTILRVNEFGGQDKNISTFNQWQDEYNYAYKSNGNNYVSASWLLNNSWGAADNVPDTVEFRFKTNGLPTSSIAYSQSLWSMTNVVGTNLIGLEYTGSGYASGSYSGSTVDPYYQYARLVYYPDISNTTDTASVYLPFYDGGWWSVMLTRNGSTFTLYAANKNTEINENTINFQASSSIITSSGDWTTTTSAISYLGYSAALNFTKFSGSLQEWRYYSVPCSQSTFNAYVMNPYSIEQSEYLAFRAALGGELYTSSVSIHPKITGSWVPTSSFISNSGFNSLIPITYVPNTEFIYFNQVVAGIQNIVSNKIQNQTLILPYSGSSDSNIPNNLVLSPYISIQQSNPASSSYSKNVDYVEVGFSPQNEINEDINSSLGYFNIGEYIGDPRQVSSSADSYPDLNTLRDSYFLKYLQNYQEWDYVRLIEFFDNSLFKMVADWVPARTDLAAGIIIKQHLLERNKYPVPQANTSSSIANVANGSTNTPFYQQNVLFTGSIPVETIIGSDGGALPNLGGQTSSIILDNNYDFTVTQVWTGSNIGPLGPVPFVDSYQYEFFNGAFSGSGLIITTQSLTAIQDYDVLINNVSSSRTSSMYLDVDYTQQNLLPVNQQLLIDNTATHATVQDSNYTLARNINPRYVGSKNTSAKYNIYTTGDSSYSKKAAIDTYVDYFAYFDWIGGSNPEYPGGGNIHLTYLVNIEGKAIPLTGDNTNLFTVSNIFVNAQTATIIPTVYSAGNPNPIVNIVEGGALIDTIAFTSGSVRGFATNYYGGNPNYDTASFQVINSQLRDSQSAGWLYSFITSSSPTYGSIQTDFSFQYYDLITDFNIINKTTNAVFTPSSPGDSTYAPILNTYLPLQQYDYVRFGSTLSQMDSSF